MNTNISIIEKNKSRAKQHDSLEIAYDIVFIINANSKGWILDKICKVIERYSDLNCYFLYSERNDRLTAPLPKARAYFFAHFAIAFWTMVKYPHVFGGSIFTYFTHFDQGKGVSSSELIDFMNLCDHVFVMNSSDQRALVSLGANQETVTTILGGADPDLFKGHKRGEGIVGFVGAYYPRKQPEKMIALIRSMSDVEFLLLAPGPGDVENDGMLWRNWAEFQALIALPNLRYIEAPYEEYPQYFDQMDVYVSLSSQEGGPIPVIEAMMSNAVALATNTGFAEDVLTGDLAQYILDVDAPVEQIAAKVRTALKDKTRNIRKIAQHISWESVGTNILNIMRPTLALDRHVPVISDHAQVNFQITSYGRMLLGTDWSFENGSADLLDSTSGSMTFKLENPNAGCFRLLFEVGLPAVSKDSEDPSEGWQIDLMVNGRHLASHENVPPSDHANIVSWLTLSEQESAQAITLSVTCTPPLAHQADTTAMAVRLHDMRWDRLNPDFETTEYDFTSTGNLREYKCNRWYNPERLGSWSNAPVATTALFVPAAETDARIVPVVTGRTIGAGHEGGHEVTIQTSFCGTTAQQTFSDENNSGKEFALDPIAVPAGASGPLLITFKRTRTFQPNELFPDADDKRNLSFQLQKISLLDLLF
jgi:glycosyltransferase involved in cell wall biosynthesis